MNELNAILQEATAAIEADYYRLNVDGGPAIYRERVYCYELYHQMRCRWPSKEACPFYLNGEVDKSGHPRGLRGVPDLLVHGPGDMNKNHAIIEVKNQSADNDQIRIDLIKLTRFAHDAGYRRSIYLIYGTDADQLVDRITKTARSIPDLAAIEVWLHQQVGHPAECLKRLEALR
jgi:hypothetical protein